MGLAESMVGGGDHAVDQTHVDSGSFEHRRQLRPREVDVADEHNGNVEALRGAEQFDGFGDRPQCAGFQVELCGDPGRRVDPAEWHQRPDLVERALGCRDLGVCGISMAPGGSSLERSSVRRASDRR